jgi:N-methylhydantoinase A
VTDANLVLGRIPPSLALGGRIDLDPDAARAALQAVADRVGLGVEAVAGGIIEIVDTHMERALRAVSVEEGADPRDSVLVAFGGAGALHATRLAKRLGITRTLVPPLSGVFSALGLLLARPVSDAAKTVMLGEGDGALAISHREVLTAARTTFSTDHGNHLEHEAVWADVRYAGQSHELTVPFGAGWLELRKDFEDLHLARFGFSRPGESIEVVNVRAEVTGPSPITWADIPKLEERPSGVEIGASVLRREPLAPGDVVEGPMAVVEADSALWLEHGDVMSVHDDGTLQIDC